jgi:hypothetical protein
METLFTANTVRTFKGLEIDVARDRLYWSEREGSTVSIKTSNRDFSTGIDTIDSFSTGVGSLSSERGFASTIKAEIFIIMAEFGI